MAPPRRRRDASLGQIPLSSGEIELYSRQDEAARRRRRLLAVRDQERRLAQQVTQRYRQNLQRLQRGKSERTQRQLSAQQHKMLTELHARYQSSLQSMGAAQRNARLKLLELMETAHDERHKWAFNARVAGKQRLQEAQEVREEEEKKRTERRRQVEQNVERLKVLTGQQRRQASARARHEQQLAEQRAKDREEIERLRREQSPEEVFVTPRPKAKDVQAYRLTRTHCVVPMEKQRPAVTVIRHNRRHPTALRGEQEADKYREEVDRRRERDRLVVEEQQDTAADRGKTALGNVTSRQQGQQALEWLALVDKMERRARGMEFGGEEDVALDTGDAGGVRDDPDMMAERAFARMLGLDEDSVELSAFSIDTEDDRSVGLGDTDHEQADGDKVADDEPRSVGEGSTAIGEEDAHLERSTNVRQPNPASSQDAEGLMTSRNNEIGEDSARSTSSRVLRSSATGRLGDHRHISSSSVSIASEGEDFRVEIGAPGHQASQVPHLAFVQEDQTALSGSSFALSRLDQVVSDRAKSLEQRFIDQHMLSFSSSEGQSAHEGSGDTNIHHPDLTSNDAHPSVNVNPSQMMQLSMQQHQQARGSYAEKGHPSNMYQPMAQMQTQQHPQQAMTTAGQIGLSPTSAQQYDRPVDTSTSVEAARGNAGGTTNQMGRHDSSQRTMMNMAMMNNAASGGVGTISQSASSPHQPSVAPPRSMPMESSRPAEMESRHGGWQSSPAAGAPTPGGAKAQGSTINTVSSAPQQEDHAPKGREALAPPAPLPVQPVRSRMSFSSILNESESPRGDTPRGNVSMVIRQQESPRDSEQQRQQQEQQQQREQQQREQQREQQRREHYDPYRQQIDHQARRSSTSAVSIAQYSLPPSDTQTSFDDSLHPGYGDDSFVNELVPMFPKGVQPPPSQSLEGDSQALEEYDVQLVAPNMSRMLTADQRSSFGRSRQRPAHQDPQAAATENSRYQARPRGVEASAVSLRSEKKVLSFSRRLSISSSSDSFDYEMGTKSVDTSVEEPRARHQPDSRRDSVVHQVRESRKSSLADDSAADDRSDISSESGVSSLGFAVQLNLAAGISRKRNQDGGRREVPSHSSLQQRRGVSDDEPDDQSNMSERSFASSSSLSMDANINSLSEMTSAVDNSLPLRLRLPAMMYGIKDMTKPPAPIAWSASSVSSDRNEELERLPHSDRRSMSSSSSSMSEQEQEQEQELQEQELQQQREPERKRAPRRDTTAQKPDFSDNSGVDDRSDISSESGVSSLGFAVQLNLAAGISRKRNQDGGRREVPSHSSLQQRRGVSDDEPDDQSNMSERSFASSSSLSMDAHTNSLAKMTSAVNNSLPLRLRLPAMMHGKKDMTKPPAPIAWSASSVSSASVAEPNEELERLPHSDKNSMSRSSSSMSESLLEEQHVSPPIERNLGGQAHDNRSQQSLASSNLSKASDESSDSEVPSHGRGQQAIHFTLDEIKEKVSRLPPPPLGSLDMSQPPAPLRNLNDGQEGKEMSLAEAFQRRHPGFSRRAESHREKLKRQRDKEQEQEQEQEQELQREPERKPAPKSDTTVQDSRSRGATDPLPPEKQQLLDRLASGSRAKISSREMKERSRRLYHQLPEVVERKRQEEVMRRRRERLNELREQEKERRLQQKQRRQQQQHQHR